MPSTSVFVSVGHPVIVPRIGSTNGHSPSPHVAGAMTVSLPMGKWRYSGPPRTDSATDHLRNQYPQHFIPQPLSRALVLGVLTSSRPCPGTGLRARLPGLRTVSTWRKIIRAYGARILTQARGVRVCQDRVRGVRLEGAPETRRPRDGHHVVVARPAYIQVSTCSRGVSHIQSKKGALMAYLRQRGGSSTRLCSRCAGPRVPSARQLRLYVTRAATHLSACALPDYLPLSHLPSPKIYLRLVDAGATSPRQ